MDIPILDLKPGLKPISVTATNNYIIRGPSKTFCQSTSFSTRTRVFFDTALPYKYNYLAICLWDTPWHRSS